MNHRASIAVALKDRIISELDGSKPELYFTNLYGNASTRIYKFEEINEFPYVGIALGSETFSYLPSAQQEVWLELLVYAFVREQVNVQAELENIISDIKTVVDTGGNLSYTVNTPDGSSYPWSIIEWRIASVDTDEGLLAPHGLGQISISVKYAPPRLALRR